MNHQPPTFSGGYRSRYLAYLNQQTAPPPRGPNRWARFGRGLLSFAIFVALFLALLTLFGFWLSRTGRSAPLAEASSVNTVAQPAVSPSATPVANKRHTARLQ